MKGCFIGRAVHRAAHSSIRRIGACSGQKISAHAPVLFVSNGAKAESNQTDVQATSSPTSGRESEPAYFETRPDSSVKRQSQRIQRETLLSSQPKRRGSGEKDIPEHHIRGIASCKRPCEASRGVIFKGFGPPVWPQTIILVLRNDPRGLVMYHTG